MSSLCLVVVVMLICFEPVFGNFGLCSVYYFLSSIIICFEPVFSNFCLIIIIIIIIVI